MKDNTQAERIHNEYKATKRAVLNTELGIKEDLVDWLHGNQEQANKSYLKEDAKRGFKAILRYLSRGRIK